MPPPDVAEHVARTVETVASLHAKAEQGLTAHQRLIERVTTVLGRPSTVYAAFVAVLAWLVLNFALERAGVAAPDPPPFVGLTGVASVLALLMTLMILTTQNRQARQAEKRAQLDLQVNLLGEQKAAKIIELLQHLRHDLPNVEDRADPVAEAMKTTVDAYQVMEAFEKTIDAGDERDTSDDAVRGERR